MWLIEKESIRDEEMVWRHNYEFERKEALRVFFDLSRTFVVANASPLLRWLDMRKP